MLLDVDHDAGHPGRDPPHAIPRRLRRLLDAHLPDSPPGSPSPGAAGLPALGDAPGSPPPLDRPALPLSRGAAP